MLELSRGMPVHHSSTCFQHHKSLDFEGDEGWHAGWLGGEQGLFLEGPSEKGILFVLVLVEQFQWYSEEVLLSSCVFGG